MKIFFDVYNWLEDSSKEKCCKWIDNQNEKTRLTFLSEKKNTNKLISDEDADDFNFFLETKNYKYRSYTKSENQILERKKKKNNNGKWEEILIIVGEKSKKSKYYINNIQFLNEDDEIGMIYFNKNGSDRTIVREFNFLEKKYVKKGFQFSLFHNSIMWIDENTIIAGYELSQNNKKKYINQIVIAKFNRFEEGITKSIIFRSVKQIKRIILEKRRLCKEVIGVAKIIYDTYERDIYFINTNIKMKKINIPSDCGFSVGKTFSVLQLKKDLIIKKSKYKTGDLLAIHTRELYEDKQRYFRIFRSNKKIVLLGHSLLKNYVLIYTLRDVSNVIYIAKLNKCMKSIKRVRGVPNDGVIRFYWNNFDGLKKIKFSHEDILHKRKFYYFNIKKAKLQQECKSSLSNGIIKKQFALSKDGTIIPFYIAGLNDFLEPKKAIVSAILLVW